MAKKTASRKIASKKKITSKKTIGSRKAAKPIKPTANEVKPKAATKNLAQSKAATKNAAQSKPTTKNAAVGRASTKNAAVGRASTKNAAVGRAATKNAAIGRATTRNAPVARATAKNAPGASRAAATGAAAPAGSSAAAMARAVTSAAAQAKRSAPPPPAAIPTFTASLVSPPPPPAPPPALPAEVVAPPALPPAPVLTPSAAASAQASPATSFPAFFLGLHRVVESSRLSKVKSMLAAERFQLYADVSDAQLVGVVASQSEPGLFYSARLTRDGDFACCTQNLNPCGGLRGALCKHLLVLICGLTRTGQLDAERAHAWVEASTTRKPALDKGLMSETFLRHKGAQAGDVDWRPTETVPEDYFAL